MAIGTLMPLPRFSGFDLNGDPVSGGQLWSYIAGTTTPVSTFTDVALTVPHTNPILLNAAGRPASSGGTELGVYLTPGTSYKFVLQNALGAIIWTQDNVAAVPAASQTVDLIGTVGEPGGVTAGAAVYLSSGAGGTAAGQWYLTDADFTYASSTATITGIAVAAIPTAAQGAIRTTGAVQIPGAAFTPGGIYYAAAAAGTLTSVKPTNVRAIGQALDLNTLLLDGGAAVIGNFAVLNAPNTFTAGQTIFAAPGTLDIWDASQAVGARAVRIINQSAITQFYSMNETNGSPAGAVNLTLDRAGSIKVGADVYEKQRTTPMGHWIPVPYSAANFSGLSGMTWAVTAGNVNYQTHALIGKTLLYSFSISSSTIGGTLTYGLTIALPAGFTAPGADGTFWYSNGGPWAVGAVSCNGVAIVLTREPSSGTLWTAGVCNIKCLVVLQIN